MGNRSSGFVGEIRYAYPGCLQIRVMPWIEKDGSGEWNSHAYTADASSAPQMVEAQDVGFVHAMPARG